MVVDAEERAALVEYLPLGPVLIIHVLDVRIGSEPEQLEEAAVVERELPGRVDEGDTGMEFLDQLPDLGLPLPQRLVRDLRRRDVPHDGDGAGDRARSIEHRRATELAMAQDDRSRDGA